MMILYRLWCGKKCYSHWLPTEAAALRLAIRHGLAFEGANDSCHLGPLTWIEVGERRYARSRTVSLGRLGSRQGRNAS